MKNIPYIIIFTLLLALGLLYTKTINYENITDELLSENITQINKIESLKLTNSTLNQTIINLETNIQNLEDNLSKEQNSTQQYTQSLEEQILLLESKLPYIDDDNNHINNTIEIEQFDNNLIEQIDENEITGFN